MPLAGGAAARVRAARSVSQAAAAGAAEAGAGAARSGPEDHRAVAVRVASRVRRMRVGMRLS
ncbi:hypothetical protein GCM10018980_20600 [Streptomyces capoamus]|uniref:Uncharacterized protein n=1 Tax=Streptomyces capoamus TaxID=68183 RepID=A0A919EVA2_9ACTN|nr:hypothetical protein GCM10010501_03280 [Streptomyces libani subsp. rufus]GHG43644.1 hypothetical protein GCM10018980_20600 [Streptomyces capoamus]